MCGKTAGFGKWSLCPGCETETAERIVRRLGLSSCKTCGEQNAQHGLCTKCRKTIFDAENKALDPDDAPADDLIRKSNLT
jgi:hypothetical protein